MIELSANTVAFIIWWKLYLIFHLFIDSPGDVYRRESGRCRTLLFFLNFFNTVTLTKWKSKLEFIGKTMKNAGKRKNTSLFVLLKSYRSSKRLQLSMNWKHKWKNVANYTMLNLSNPSLLKQETTQFCSSVVSSMALLVI